MSFFCISLFRKKRSQRQALEEWIQEHRSLTQIPNEPLSHPETMRILRLNSNRISELPKAVFNLQLLTYLNLSDNDIMYLSPAISHLINLEYLDLSKNALGEIPSVIYNCKELTYLDLSTNPIGRLPDSITALVNLHTLLLNDACLETLPVSLGKLQKLIVLELRENCLSDLPESMSRLLHLERIDLGCNEFENLPPLVGNMISLKELWADINMLSRLPADLGRLHELQFLELSENKLEVLPPELGNLSELRDFFLGDNLLVELPETIGGMSSLSVLKIERNRLMRLPASIGRLEQMTEFCLTSNGLQELPRNIGYLKKLSTLIIDENNLTHIPPQLGSCSKLTVLSLRDNQIISLPSECGFLHNLSVLNLVGNRLQFLPFSLTSLRHLSAIWLSKHQSKPMVDLQSEKDERGQLVLTCVLFPQQSLDDTAPPPSANSAHHQSLSDIPKKSSAIAFNVADEKVSKDSIAYPKEFHSKIMARRTSRDSGDGKSPKVTNSPYREQTDSGVRMRLNRDANKSINRPYSFLKALDSDEVPSSPHKQEDGMLPQLPEVPAAMEAQGSNGFLPQYSSSTAYHSSSTYPDSMRSPVSTVGGDIDQPLLDAPKSVASPLNWFDTSATIPYHTPQQKMINAQQSNEHVTRLVEEDTTQLLMHSSQESTESTHHYKQAMNGINGAVMNTNNSGHSGADVLHGAVPYRTSSRDNLVQFSPSPDGVFHGGANVLRMNQRVPSAPSHRIPTISNHQNHSPSMHMRQRSADIMGDSDQFFNPPHSHHSEPNFDTNIEPDWYLSPNAKPKYQKSTTLPVNSVAPSYIMDRMRRRSESPTRAHVVSPHHSGRVTPARHFQYPPSNTGSTVQFGRTNTPTPRVPGLEGKLIMVELFKNPALGISITGGINGENLWHPGDPSLYVYDMAEGKPAQLSGQIEIGDKIIMVNGYDVTNVTHEEAAGLLQNSGTKVVLQVYREPSETLL